MIIFAYLWYLFQDRVGITSTKNCSLETHLFGNSGQIWLISAIMKRGSLRKKQSHATKKIYIFLFYALIYIFLYIASSSKEKTQTKKTWWKIGIPNHWYVLTYNLHVFLTPSVETLGNISTPLEADSWKTAQICCTTVSIKT